MKYFFIILFLSGVLYIHFRGKVRHPFLKQMFDHSAFVAPFNLFMYAFSKVPTTPYLPLSLFPEMQPITDSWQIIREEALNMREQERIAASKNNNDAGFNSFFKTGWKRFYLKWYSAQHPSAIIYCPKTVAILNGIPSIKAAMFAELPPGAKLNPHRDPYGGSLRYHLGLVTPNDDQCYINVDGVPYSWRDGECVMFDETYIHEAYNKTNVDRIILFCDVERPMKYRWAQAVNRFLAKNVVSAASSPNEEGDQTGFINKIFYIAWVIGQYRRRFKNWNKTVYKVTKFSLIALVVFAIWKI
ncbi:MAG: lipid A hydroxylase LpxO [Methylotenera sp.]|nr:lipid A hydroxylase LpxO [Methylotenera sp.]